MTVSTDQTPDRSKPATIPTPTTSPQRGRRAPSVGSAVGAALTLAGIVLAGFAAYLFAFSGLYESHAQATLYKSFRNQLGQFGNAIAPTGPTTPGNPIALLDIPALSITQTVVVEGTAPASLVSGPGHRIDTPLPGAPGVSAIYGRRLTSGGPFAHLDALRAGDTVKLTTGHGIATYTVSALGIGGRAPIDTAANRLVLVTSDSPWMPRHPLVVSARLNSRAIPDDGGHPTPMPAERALGNDSGAVQPLMMWGLALDAASILAAVASSYGLKRLTYLLATPVVLAIVWNIYENAAQLLPNLL